MIYVLPEDSHIAGNIFMKFINDIRGRLRCKVVMKDSTDELYKDLGTSYFNNDTHQPVYMIGTDEDYFKQTLYSSSDYFCYSDADNYDLYESVMSGETVLYLLHIFPIYLHLDHLQVLYLRQSLLQVLMLK